MGVPAPEAEQTGKAYHSPALPERRFPCIHRGNKVGTHTCAPCKGARTQPIFNCGLGGRCTEYGSSARDESGNLVKMCFVCEDRHAGFDPVPPDRMKYAKNADGQPCTLANTFRGKTAFLACGGPSLSSAPLESLPLENGCIIAAVNNAATLIRPHVWISVDSIARFHPSILDDPGVMCFLRSGNDKAHSRRWNGEKLEAWKQGMEFPNCWFYNRHPPAQFDATTFLRTPAVPDGPRICVMFASVRILYDLGIRRICLLGCDWHMSDDQPYAFDEAGGRAAGNNRLYNEVGQAFAKLQPIFLDHGLKVVNCTPGSKLEHFPFSTVEDELTAIREGVESGPTLGLYTGK